MSGTCCRAGDEVTNPRRLVLERFRVEERRQLTERGAYYLVRSSSHAAKQRRWR